MKKLNKFTVIIEKDSDDDFFVATVPQLRGCHTQAKDMNTLLKRVKEAIQLCVKVEKTVPKPLDFIGFQEIRVAC